MDAHLGNSVMMSLNCDNTRPLQSVRILFMILLSCSSASSLDPAKHERTVEVQPDEHQYIDIHPHEIITCRLNISHITSSFVVFQAHAYTETIFLSLTPLPTHQTTVTGRHVGVVTMIGTATAINWTLSANDTQRAEKFRVLLLASLYGPDVPVPGGCNMEFPLEIDPNLHATYGQTMTRVLFQYARQTAPLSRSCDVQDQRALRYDLYQQYVDAGETSTFRGIESMLTAKGTKDYGRLIRSFNIQDRTEQLFAAYMGKGVVYSIVVSQQTNSTRSTSAVYVPVMAYGCHGDAVYCSILDRSNAFALVVMILVALAGLFICFLGHRFFLTEMFAFGFMGTFLVCSIPLAKYTDFDLSLLVFVSALCGAVGGAIWWLFWYYKGIPVISVLYVGLVAGYIIASLIFNLTPLGGWTWWQSPVNYGLGFATAVLVIPVILLAFTRILNILCCALVGSYLVVFAVDVFVGGSISQIVLLSVRKSVWEDMLKARVTLPYQWSDLLLAVVWILLTIGGTTVQYIRERRRAPFPPCPWQQRQLQKHYISVSQAHPEDAGIGQLPPGSVQNSYEADDESDDENEPLLQARRQMEQQVAQGALFTTNDASNSQ